MSRSSTRVSVRRHLVTRVENGVDGVASCSFNYAFDAAGRPVMRNDDVFGYNMRGEEPMNKYIYDDSQIASDEFCNFAPKPPPTPKVQFYGTITASDK